MNTDLPNRALPDKGVIDVWHIQLDGPIAPGVNPDAVLSVDERARANRFVFARDATRFRVCRTLLRFALAWYLNESADLVRLTAGKYGKPRLVDSRGLYFNVTHAQGRGLIAFGTMGEVGVDMEPIDRDIDPSEIAASNFTANEIATIAAAPTEQEKQRAFLRLWTRKESVLKAAGFGIVRGLDTVDVTQQITSVAGLNGTQANDGASRWMVRDLKLEDGFVGAIAAPCGDWSIRQWSVDLTNRVFSSPQLGRLG